MAKDQSSVEPDRVGDGSHGERRVLYVAVGADFVREGARSFASLRRHNPDLPVTVVTDLPDLARDLFDDPAGLVHFKPHRSPTRSFFDKIDGLLQSDGGRCLYLDTDTYLAGDVSHLFDVLDRFDIAATNAILQPKKAEGLLRDVPVAFPEFNTGVIVYRNTPEVQAAFERWKTAADEQVKAGIRGHDQPSFRLALYESQLRIVSLTPEYNFRYPFPAYASGRVLVFHGRDRDPAAVEARVNRVIDMRVHVPGKRVITHRRVPTAKLKTKSPLLQRGLSVVWHGTGLSRIYRSRLGRGLRRRYTYRRKPQV